MDWWKTHRFTKQKHVCQVGVKKGKKREGKRITLNRIVILRGLVSLSGRKEGAMGHKNKFGRNWGDERVEQGRRGAGKGVRGRIGR